MIIDIRQSLRIKIKDRLTFDSVFFIKIYLLGNAASGFSIPDVRWRTPRDKINPYGPAGDEISLISNSRRPIAIPLISDPAVGNDTP